MHRLLTLFTVSATILSASAQDVPMTHQDMAEALLDFLSRTELCLRSCVDETSATAAIPQLRQLAAEADKLAAAQAALPEPTVQDFMAVQDKMGNFDTICRAIQTHLVQMSEKGLMTDEIRQILKVSL